jgi:hypothetical protein
LIARANESRFFLLLLCVTSKRIHRKRNEDGTYASFKGSVQQEKNSPVGKKFKQQQKIYFSTLFSLKVRILSRDEEISRARLFHPFFSMGA